MKNADTSRDLIPFETRLPATRIQEQSSLGFVLETVATFGLNIRKKEIEELIYKAELKTYRHGLDVQLSAYLGQLTAVGRESGELTQRIREIAGILCSIGPALLPEERLRLFDLLWELTLEGVPGARRGEA